MTEAPATYDELVEVWRRCDLAPGASEWRSLRRTPVVLVVARCVIAVVLLAVLLGLPSLLRHIGGYFGPGG
jgi:hypothetical protein